MKTETVELVRIPEVKTGDLEWAGLDIITKAEEIPAVIPDDQIYELCAKVIIEAKDLIGRMKERVADEKRGRFERHRMVCDLETAMLAFPNKALAIAEPKRAAYEREAERKRREREAELTLQAKRKEEEKQLAEALYLEAMGENDAADRAASQPVEPPPVILGRAVPKVKGLRATTPVWAGQIFDLMALVQAVAAKAQPLAAILGIEPLDGHRGIYQSPFWNQQAKNLMRTQESSSIGPGVRAYDRNDSAG